MSLKLKTYIGNKIYKALRRHETITPEKLKCFIRIGNLQKGWNPTLNISLDTMQKHLGITNSNDILGIESDKIIRKVYVGNNRAERSIVFDIYENVFIKDVLEHSNEPDVFHERKKVVVEYSSPNIAKPFHVGHIRSTIIGNFIANINKYLGHDVVRINYLGDWGTQFGLLQVGLEMSKLTDEDIKANPIQVLYNAYVKVNKLAENDPSINERARNIFMELEKGESKKLEVWKQLNQYTIDELNILYKRLGVSFDVYNFESMYSAKDIKKVIDNLQKRKILHDDPDGKRVAILNNRKVPLIKSDGSMLYLTRDIAAAMDRYEKYKFDQMYYIVDNSQTDHFNALQEILFKMDLPWAGRLKHVKFGRIRGMSTRKGNAVFLKDILDEAKDLMQQKQIESPTTKVAVEDGKIADILGTTCVIVNDLKQRRQKDYQFDWNKTLQAQGDTGVRLQYTHCRLCSLQKQNQIEPAEFCHPEFLNNPETLGLVVHLAQFNEVLRKCQQDMEACALVVYLFQLCNHVNKAMKFLRVRDQEPSLASQRMLLFDSSRKILKQGMEVLGLQPLQEM